MLPALSSAIQKAQILHVLVLDKQRHEYLGYQCTIVTSINILNTYTETINYEYSTAWSTTQCISHKTSKHHCWQTAWSPLALWEPRAVVPPLHSSLCLGLGSRAKGAFASQPQEPFRCTTISGVGSQWQPHRWQASPWDKAWSLPPGLTHATAFIKQKELPDLSLLHFLLPDLPLTAVLPGDCTEFF